MKADKQASYYKHTAFLGTEAKCLPRRSFEAMVRQRNNEDMLVSTDGLVSDIRIQVRFPSEKKV
jgi:hypothetical protein